MLFSASAVQCAHGHWTLCGLYSWIMDWSGYLHRRQPRRGCRGRIPTNILVGGDINGNVPTNIRGGSVVEYELKTLKT